jgi:hypothetical protein
MFFHSAVNHKVTKTHTPIPPHTNLQIHKFTNCSLPQGHSHILFANVCFANISPIHQISLTLNSPTHQFTNLPIYQFTNCSLPQGHSHILFANVCFANISPIYKPHTIPILTLTNIPIYQFTNSLIYLYLIIILHKLDQVILIFKIDIFFFNKFQDHC